MAIGNRPIKRRRLESCSPYNRLPAPEGDLDPDFGWRAGYLEGFKTRYIQKTDSQEWGRPDVAAVRAVHVSEITSANERLVRTYHPSLRDHHHVYVSDPQYGTEVWLVYGEYADTKAGGRDIHPYPEDHVELYKYAPVCIIRPHRMEEYLFGEGINTRKLLSAEQLDGFRELFPAAVGVRVLVAGFIVVLFKSYSDLRDIYRSHETWVMQIGGLRTLYDTLNVTVSAEAVSGMQVSDGPENTNGLACLGLKLRMKDDTEAITTVTHGFVKIPNPSPMFLTCSNWVLKIKQAIQRLIRPPSTSDTLAIGIVRKVDENSPIGKEVWLAADSKRVGTITKSFDNPSSLLPYPAGYQHDLSLITDANLPSISSPSGYAQVSEWASYSSALSGSNVYAIKQTTNSGRWAVLRGTVDTDPFRTATVIGTEYLWDRASRSQTAALLWKTAEPSSPANGWSGCVLCLGSPTDASAKAIVFKNYQTTCYSAASLNGERQLVLVKGGFLLPEEIRSATIVADRISSGRCSDTFPRNSKEGKDLERRTFSAYY